MTLGHRPCFRSGFSPWQGLEWSFPLREEDRMIAFEVALMFWFAVLCKAKNSHYFLALYGVVPPAPSWDGEPVLVAAVLVTHDGVLVFHSS